MSDKVYFGIIYAEYDIFNPDLNMDEVLKNKKGTFKLRKKNKSFNTEELFVTAALKQIQRGTSVNFEISKESFINTDKKIEKLKLILVMVLDIGTILGKL